MAINPKLVVGGALTLLTIGVIALAKSAEAKVLKGSPQAPGGSPQAPGGQKLVQGGYYLINFRSADPVQAADDMQVRMKDLSAKVTAALSAVGFKIAGWQWATVAQVNSPMRGAVVGTWTGPTGGVITSTPGFWIETMTLAPAVPAPVG